MAPIVEALDAVPLGDLIPPGLSLDLEIAVLAVFTDLDSRIAALAGGMRYLGYPDLPGALDCLEGGGAAATRFAADLARRGTWPRTKRRPPPPPIRRRPGSWRCGSPPSTP